MINIILSGGSGSRLWPLSRTKLPKQFVKIFDQKSLFQQTLIRNKDFCESSYIVTNNEQYFLALDQYESTCEVSHKNLPRFLLEPIGRNTAPAITLACLTLDKDEIVLVTPSDHLIKNQKNYAAAIKKATQLASQGYLVTFGITPSYAETGFGYIEYDNENVISFKEKPDSKTAEEYIKSGQFLWNSGMFCFKAGQFIKELEKHNAVILDSCKKALKDQNLSTSVLRIDFHLMSNIPEDSIDYAVMEHSDNIKVVPCDLDWSDLGSYDSLYKETKNTISENAILEQSENAKAPLFINSKSNLVVNGNRQIALIDIHDLLIVDTTDALLISKKGSSQLVKNIVEKLKKSASELTDIHPLAYRPWGSYEVLLSSSQYKVKQIIVQPGGKLSLQKHHHRNEHWVVVSGKATVTIDGKQSILNQNESTYIKMGQVHRLENKEANDLIMIEVQVGNYTGEDDIIRFDDAYDRQ
jgi:mannose-1-phosphate guanylyltransferase